MIHPLIICVALVYGADDAPGPKSVDNRPCYSCHEDLAEETITEVHIQEDIGCTSCHGDSVEHREDELESVKPDIVFGRQEVVAHCRQCHEAHENPERVARYLERRSGRYRPNGRQITEQSICTDCHGKHNRFVKPSPDSTEASWTSLLDDSSLRSWEMDGGDWALQGGVLVVQAPAGKATRVERPAAVDGHRVELKFRASGPQAARLYLGESRETSIVLAAEDHPPGSLLVAGRPAVVPWQGVELNSEEFNVLSVAVGDYLQVELNGTELYRLLRRAEPVTVLGIAARKGSEDAKLALRDVRYQKLK